MDASMVFVAIVSPLYTVEGQEHPAISPPPPPTLSVQLRDMPWLPGSFEAAQRVLAGTTIADVEPTDAVRGRIMAIPALGKKACRPHTETVCLQPGDPTAHVVRTQRLPVSVPPVWARAVHVDPQCT